MTRVGGAAPGLAEGREGVLGVPVLVGDGGAGVAAVHDATWSPDAPGEAEALHVMGGARRMRVRDGTVARGYPDPQSS